MTNFRKRSSWSHLGYAVGDSSICRSASSTHVTSFSPTPSACDSYHSVAPSSSACAPAVRTSGFISNAGALLVAPSLATRESVRPCLHPPLEHVDRAPQPTLLPI